MPSIVWVYKGRRTPLSHRLVRSVHAGLKAHGWTRDNRKAVYQIIGELHDNDPAFKKWAESTLRWAYYETAPLLRPVITEEEKQWASILIEWGKETKRHPRFMSAKQARKIVDRLIEVYGRADLDQCFVHIDRSIHRNGREKIKYLLLVIDRRVANPLYSPIPFSRRGRHDVTAGRIETYLGNAPEKQAHKRDIAAALGIPKTTVQTTLGSLVRAHRIVHLGNGVYGLEGVPYIPTDKAILDVLGRGGERSCAELRAETGKSEGAVHAALHRLHKAGSIVLTERGTYALAGNARPHIYARDAVSDAMRSTRSCTS